MSCTPGNRRALRSGKRTGRRSAVGRDRSTRLAYEPLEPRLVLDGTPLITEFMAINDTGLETRIRATDLDPFDGAPMTPDWIEIYNPTNTTIDISGWQLEDDKDDWDFPAGTMLSAQGYLVVFASNENISDPALDENGYFHTNFKLSGDGEDLRLYDDSSPRELIHAYNNYGKQTADISFGLGQNITTTDFVLSGDQSSYLVPTVVDDPLAWTAVGFDDSGWTTGDTGLGYSDLVPGFHVDNYQANVSLGHLTTAWDVINDPAKQSNVWTVNDDVINYLNSGGAGHYTNLQSDYPGFVGGDQNNFVIDATAFLTIPSAGSWSFGVNSDDGFQLTIPGTTTTASAGSHEPLGTDTIRFDNGRGAADTIGVFTFPTAGVYPMRLIQFEGGGGSSGELFARSGSFTGWNSDFDLVGDTANGGLLAESEPVGGGGGGGSGSGFSALIETDVESVLEGVNSSLFVRIPFNVSAGQLPLESLTLKMKYDDGYIAYLNGEEIHRENFVGAPAWDSNADTDRSDAEATTWQNADASSALAPGPGQLIAGNNVLAIHAMNLAAGDGDFLVLPELQQILFEGVGEHFFAIASPGEANTDQYWLAVDDTAFSEDRGFYDTAFNLQITSDTEGALIVYTTDSSEPTYDFGDPGAANGTVVPAANSTTPPVATVSIPTTTVVRAAAFKENYVPTNIDTHTYIFLDDVLQQPTDPAGFPATWNGTSANYQVDPDVVNNPAYSDEIKDDLRAIPTVSIVTDVDNMFGPTGIYSNPGDRSPDKVAPSSIEWIEADGDTLFQVDAGVRVVGGASRGANNRKHSLRVLFKSEFGPGTLKYPIFGKDAADEFNTFTLRAGFNDVWPNAGNATYLQDRWASERQLAMGDLGSYGNYVHLYIDGLYWGLYNPVERPDDAYAASYLGGEKEDYDAYHTNGLATGTATAWNKLRADVNALPGLAGDPVGLAAKYAEIELELDIPAFIDYFMVNHYAYNTDWPHNNWWGTYNREGGGKWRFHSWDAEFGLRNVGATNVTGSTGGQLGNLYAKLRDVPVFKSLFADQIHKQFFNGGALTLQVNLDWLDEAEARMTEGIVGESARWGDGWTDNGTPRTRDGQWIPQLNWLRTTFFPQRSSVTSGAGSSVLQQYINAGLYPNVVAPSFEINSQYQHGGIIDLGDSLTIDAPAGTIYYTLDGSDPRLDDGSISPQAVPYAGPVLLTLSGFVKSRAWDGGTWSALNEAIYYFDLTPDIRVSEIMYNPADPTAAEILAGYDSADDFEFIEITNTSIDVLPLDGLRFDNGIEFTFPAMSINPGDYVVVVSNEDAFNFRYGSPAITIAGQYGTGLIDGGSQLANGGEDIELDAPIGGKIQDFDFADGWYDHTDGDGFSLTIRNVDGELDNWDEKDGWRPSNTPGGSPGFEDAVPNPDPGSVIITEVLTHTDGTDGDVIELRNVSGVAIDVGGWWLSDQKKDEFGVEVLTKYQIPANTVIDPKGYVTLNETGGFGFGVIPFALSELGDDVYLSSDASGVAGGYREHVDFGGAPNGISIGLHIKSTGGSDITLLRTPFLGQGNGAPYFEDLVINEVMYHPQNATPDEIAAGFINDDDFEFVEIYNRSTTTTHTLSDFHISSGIGFTFGWYDVAGSSSESWTLEPGATATWNTTGLAADTYEVFARWDVVDGVGAKRDLDGQAIYSIAHDGGTTDVVRDQKPGAADPPHPLDGWVSLGSYAFDGDGEVVLTRGTNNPGNWTIADQVKFVDSLLAETVVDTPTLDSWTTANGPTSLGPGEYAVIVSNRPAFDYRYNFPAIAGQSDVAIAGQYTGSLSNSGDGIKLMRKGFDEALADTPYYRIDFVNYNDKAPWPTEPDGDGPSLSRNDPYGPSIPFPYGNDPESWFAGGVLTMGTPGERNAPADLTEPTVPQNLTAVVNLPYAQVALNWDAATDPDSYVDHYAIYRNGSRIGSSATTSYVDTTANLTIPYSYKVAAVNRDGTKSDRSTRDDISIPALISHSVLDDTHISLVFSEPLDQTSAEDHLANYAFDGTLISATLEPDTVTVTLVTVAMNVSQAYNLTIDSLLTVAGALMPPGRQVSFVYGAAIGANAPTVAAGIADFSVSEDAANSEFVLSTVFADADAGDHLTFTVAVNTNPNLVQASIGAGELHLDYAADHNGTVDITVRATDLAGTWVEDTFTVTVDSIGDNPSVALPISDVTADEDAALAVLNLAGVFYDPDVIYFDSNIAGDDDLLTLTVTGNTDSGLVTASIVGGQLTLTYQGDQHGSADITVRATDDSAVNFIEDTFTVTVNPVNDPPVVSVPLADVSVVENAAPTVLNLAAAFGDVDIATAGDNLTYSVTGNTNPGLVDTSVVGTLTYASNTYGTAQITVRATDTLGDWAEETFAVGVGSAGTAKVEHVLVRGSTWSEGFLDHLDAQLLAHPTISGQGYHLLTGGSQLTMLTWNNIDQLVISFSKDVNVQQSDLSLVGVNVASYSFSDFSYDGATFTATWNLSSPIAADKLLIDLDASSITEVATGNPLDGEWTDGVDTFPSGDDTSGGDFQFRFDVLPGNADVAGSVDAADVTAVLDRIFSVPGGGSYSRNSDLDGSGRIDFVDWAIVQSKLGDTLPGGNPTPPPSPPAPSSGPLQIFLSQTGPSAEEPTRDIARDTIEEIADEFASAPPLIGPLRVPIASSVVHDDVFAELGADQSSRPAGRNQRYLFGRRSHHESTESSRARRRRRDTVDSDIVDSITADTVFEMFHSEHRRRETIRRDRTIDQDWINKAERK